MSAGPSRPPSTRPNHLTDATQPQIGIPRSDGSLRRRQRHLSRDLAREDDLEHPLSGNDEEGESRPTLKRLTSEAEKMAGSSKSESEGSIRGSFDLLRMNLEEGGDEVEVLVHRVKPTESLAGIALLYGIDKSTLRKTNKLWPSDPVHLRTHLYVPLEACRWNIASETFIRGPGEGQVTMIAKPKSDRRRNPHVNLSESRSAPIFLLDRSVSGDIPPARGNGKGKGKVVEIEVTNGDVKMTPDIEGLNEYEEWSDSPGDRKAGPSRPSLLQSSMSLNEDHFRDAEVFQGNLEMGSRNGDVVGNGLDDSGGGRSGVEKMVDDQDEDRTPRILDVVRLPSSQLRFFPKSHSTSQDVQKQHRRAASLSTTSLGPSIHHDLHTLPRPLQPKPPRPNVVRIRPPSYSSLSLTPTSNSTSGIAQRLSSLFAIPSPTQHTPSYLPNGLGMGNGNGGNNPRMSFESGFSSSRRSSAASSPQHQEVVLELHPRAGRSSETLDTIRMNRDNTHDKSRKID
ncbi:hypothetical protein TREMEDRAFT_58102 [Tremella mesenterica DSM 1558]|uniref:uncharacterized protein n=1 Tax=Tremella mesenterica (strain ATCC 24925 / CBS 8224 / DSM 1558 / NBRC 9311 / NRRL Y-6157 / RJB 2259-6 / UBC 559-6) TaxID=578456 RepID=UPI0003F49E86|nr:uncharacterized protein TREMEDRAFT_58102 [Tremella mesenterica DSM 1558]EIW71958.1 hypothetical protein TREMEDRAFT_58102 [Tremella mesenterica DSM 1558]